MVSLRSLNTIRERIGADARDRVGDGHAGQAATARERKVANCSDCVGNDQFSHFFSVQIDMMAKTQRICIII